MQNTTSSTNLLGGQGVWQQLASKDFFDVQFDIIDGHMTTGKNEAILIIDQYNKVNRNTLIMLGLINLLDTETEINFSEVLGKTYKVAINNQIYVKTGDTFENNSSKINQLNFNEMIDLEIVGIARMNRETDMGVMGSGIAYTKELTDWLLEQNSQSEIVEFMNENPTINPFTGQFYTASFDSNGNLKYSKEELRENDFRRFGGTNLPNEISIYPKDFASKNKIKEVLNNYNIDKEYEDLIVFTDLSAVVGNMITNMVNVITYVLIGLTAVSLLVSSVMISIITYASVIERTKEIGILRSVGARKKDISRVFNAENVILGFCSGTFGILISYLLCIPISLIIERFTAIAGLAKLNILNSLLLILISMFLMLVAGFIPSKIAAKKDPVKALRTE
jgi:putative ABC transport system permease protein